MEVVCGIRVVNYGGMNRTYLETEDGSSIMACPSQAVRLGYLSDDYAVCKVVIVSANILRQQNGFHYHSALSVFIWGLGSNGKTSTYNYYMSEPIVENDARCGTPSYIYRTLRYEIK